MNRLDKMESPNTGTGFRRRSTTLRRRPSVLRSRLPMKSNPYIGWFRHAPPTLGRRGHHMLGQKKYRLNTNKAHMYVRSSQHMKNSPYIGWFRHAPPSRLHLHKKHQVLLEQEISKLLELLPKNIEGNCCRPTKLVSGRLPGGSPCEDDKNLFPPLTWLDRNVSESLRESLHESSIVSGSATVKVLSRLAYWFLFPLAHDATDYPSCHDDKSEADMLPHLLPKAIHGILENDEGAYYPLEASERDDDNMTAVSEISEEDDLGASISSLAEAYHAHQNAVAAGQNELLLYEGHHRLDYVITQMDVARMARTASRHLDVESILHLPSVTFRSEMPPKAPPSTVPEHERTEEEGWSWMIVPPNPDSQEKDKMPPKKEGEDQNVCVICLEHFVDGDRLRVLPCDHLFHMGCIDRWLSGTHSDEECYTSGCPTCKKRPELQEPPSPDGSVPSWAFSRVGDALAHDSFDLAES